MYSCLVGQRIKEDFRGSDGFDGFCEGGCVESVKDFFARHPATARHRYAILNVIHCFDRMRVSRDDEFYFSFTSLTQPAWLKVETIRIAIDLDRGA